MAWVIVNTLADSTPIVVSPARVIGPVRTLAPRTFRSAPAAPGPAPARMIGSANGPTPSRWKGAGGLPGVDPAADPSALAPWARSTPPLTRKSPVSAELFPV